MPAGMRDAERNDPQAVLDGFLDDVLPKQGCWSEDDFLWLTDHTCRLVEFADGWIQVIPTPTDEHQGILHYLNGVFSAFVQVLGGAVRFAPLRLRIRAGRFREPDLLLVLDAADPRRQNRYWLGADLIVEVVSSDRPERDLVDKRMDYATARIPEYWIVDPMAETVTVLVLDGAAYREHGVFARATTATSVLIEGFGLDVSAALDAGDLR